MPPKKRPTLRQAAQPWVERAVGDGRRRRFVDEAAARLPRLSRQPVDMSGWTAPELRAYLDGPPGRSGPPRRMGADVVRTVNAMGDVLPTDAILLSRAITDTAPPPGESVNPTLRSLLESYLPESLRAYTAGRPRTGSTSAEDLLLAQLRLLHQVAVEVRRADAANNHLALKVQAAFLRERFAELTPSALSLPRPDDAPWAGMPDPAPATAEVVPEPATAPAVAVGTAHSRVDVDPVVLFARPRSGEVRLTFRLAIPKGHPTRLGCVLQTAHGQVVFRHTESRRWLSARRATGFRAPQADLTLTVPLAGTRRVVVYATSPARTSPTDCVLFVRDTDRAQTSLATLLGNRLEAAVTVVCSGYNTPAGVVVRNESTLYPDLRAACEGFGFHSITWLDPHTPIV